MGEKRQKRNYLLLKDANEEKEIEFELNYLLSLNIQERFDLMNRKSKEIKNLLISNGFRKTFKIIKRK